ncbi:hypothetical protein [Microbacterium dauci]|uniref:Uncharacterized protein n=1 Tax=Microbacterium dauci TaxID=3048008 RepID=A0ABT6ZC93_9MICO|nr:hypothetical protein [Microbacterium sp. LX3-4]MDJ1113786.1 hypothetical protein [Microbacterium sp. LX3-4]
MTITNDTRLSAITVPKAEHLDWIRVHPEILQIAPDWTTEIDLYFEGDGSVGIAYDGTWGEVQLGTAAIWRAGEVRAADDGLVVLYFKADDLNPTEADLREYARSFNDAADAVARASKAGA